MKAFTPSPLLACPSGRPCHWLERSRLVVLALFLFQAAGQPGQLMAAADLFIKDCPADVGAEPNLKKI
jgi:hypothetical protein